MQQDHERELAEAADQYLRATDDLEKARLRLKKAMRDAYADNEQQAAIIRAAKHVWTREYVRKVLGPADKDSPTN